jgi:hypothetical protein
MRLECAQRAESKEFISVVPRTVGRRIVSGYAVRTKPLARQTLRVLLGRGFLFDYRLLPRCGRSSVLREAQPLECNRAM